MKHMNRLHKELNIEDVEAGPVDERKEKWVIKLNI